MLTPPTTSNSTSGLFVPIPTYKPSVLHIFVPSVTHPPPPLAIEKIIVSIRLLTQPTVATDEVSVVFGLKQYTAVLKVAAPLTVTIPSIVAPPDTSKLPPIDTPLPIVAPPLTSRILIFMIPPVCVCVPL